MAKPLPKQGVKKAKVWAIFVGGAVSIFAATILLENNGTLFPAIKKANVASSMAQQSMAQVQHLSACCASLLDAACVGSWVMFLTCAATKQSDRTACATPLLHLTD